MDIRVNGTTLTWAAHQQQRKGPGPRPVRIGCCALLGETGLLTDELLFLCIHIYLTELGNDLGFTRSKSDPVHMLRTPPFPHHCFSRQVVLYTAGLSKPKTVTQRTSQPPVGPSELLAAHQVHVSVLDHRLYLPSCCLRLDILPRRLLNEHLVGRPWE